MTILSSPTDGYGGQDTGNGFITSNIDTDYRIGLHEVTNDQWNKFKAQLGVSVTGTPVTAYDSEPYFTGSNVASNEVSWYEAAQFKNWLNTSSGHQAAYNFTGQQGASSYTLATWNVSEADNGTNLYHHKDAFYFLPTEDEWVKAAFWNGIALQAYANASEDDLIGGLPDPAKWNHFPSARSQLWDVGSGSGRLTQSVPAPVLVWRGE